MNYKHLYFHTFSILWKYEKYIDTTELVKFCYFRDGRCLLLFQCLALVHGNSTTSKYGRSASKAWWRTFQGSAINTAINTEHSGSREPKRSKFFCIWDATSSSEIKRRPDGLYRKCVLWSAEQEMDFCSLSLYAERFLWLSGLEWKWSSVNLATAVNTVSGVWNVTYTLQKACELQICYGYLFLCQYATGY